MKLQNRSSAVMAQRIEPSDSLDFFPSPLWATRALFQFITPKLTDTCWEPACGEGHMSRVLEEHFIKCYSTDIADYGYGLSGVDFLSPLTDDADYIITNPPFNQAEEFAITALHRANKGVALLVRTSFLEGIKRYKNLFDPYPPTTVVQFTERVPMFKGRIDRNGSTATSYAWVIWDKSNKSGLTEFTWTGVCRKSLEKDSDYE